MENQSLLSDAELSLAAYADLDNSLDLSEQLNELEEAGLSLSQAQEFSSNYSLVTQFNDTQTGFSATVFKGAVGNLTLAFRGTEGLFNAEDISTDGLIATHGAGFDQIVALYNWWLRVSSPPETMVEQFQLREYQIIGGNPPPNAVRLYSVGDPTDGEGERYVYLEAAAELPSASIQDGNLSAELAADSDQKLNVTGHSLGAHLGLAFNTLFSNVTNEVTGFNTPGFKDSAMNQNFFAALGGEVPVAENSSNVTNVFADESNIGEQPWNAVAGLHFDDNPIGDVVNISIEDQAGLNSDEPDSADALNHSQQILTDSLAVFDLLTRIDPHLTEPDYKQLLNQSVVGTSASYERLVGALERLFSTGDGMIPAGNNNRDVLYEAIFELRDNTDFQSVAGQLQITPLLPTDPADKFKVRALGLDLDNPDDAIAYRYALKELNPFVTTGNPAIYEPHNQNHELELEHFSDAYLTDASEFLALKIELGAQDAASKPGEGTSSQIYRKLDDSGNEALALTVNGRGQGGPRNRFIAFGGAAADTLEGDSRTDRLYGNEGNDTLRGLASSDYLEGNLGDDTLFGGEGNDTLLGGRGNDTLYGIQEDGSDDHAADELMGGAGFDTYHVGHGDIVLDSDGDGVIMEDEQAIPVGNISLVSDGMDLFTNNDATNPVRFRQLNNGDLQAIGSFFTIRNFENGDFGITLDAAAPTPDLTLINGTAGDDLDSSNAAVEGSLDGEKGTDLFLVIPCPFFISRFPFIPLLTTCGKRNNYKHFCRREIKSGPMS